MSSFCSLRSSSKRGILAGKIDKKALLGVVDSRRIGWKLPKFSMETVEDSLRILLKVSLEFLFAWADDE